jgi:hypothetical protein
VALPAPRLDFGEVMTDREIGRREAQQRLGLSKGHFRRLLQKWKEHGLVRQVLGELVINKSANPELEDFETAKSRDLRILGELTKETIKRSAIERARQQAAIVGGVDEFKGRSHTEEGLFDEYINHLDAAGTFADVGIIKPSVRTFRQWRDDYRREGLRAFVRTYSKRPESIGPAAWQAFLKFKHQPGDPSVKKCWKRVDALAKSEHADDREWSWPKYRTVLTHYDETVHPAARSAERIGPHKTEAKYFPKITRSLEDIAAGQIAVCDERTCDFLVRVAGGDRKWRLSRPKVTATEDVRSRYRGGWVMDVAANSDSILDAYRMHCEVTETLPEEVILDNGQDYRSVAGRSSRHRKWDEFDSGRVRGAFERMQTTVHFAKVRTPWAKAIESHFNQDKDFDRTMPFYVGGSPAERPHDVYARANADILAVPTIEEARALYAKHVTAMNERQVNGDGMGNLCPRQALRQYYTNSPRRVPRETLVHFCSRMRGPVKVRRDGVRYNNIFYGKWDQEVFDIQGHEVFFLADAIDASFITLCDKDGVTLCKAFADNNLGQTQQEVRAAENMRKTAKRRLKRYAADRDASMMTTPDAITELRGRAALMEQIPDAELPAPPEPQTLRVVGAAESAGVERIAKAAGAEAIRKLKDMNAGAAALNQRAARRPSFRDLAVDEDVAAPRPVVASFRELENPDESESSDAT